jgi:hypothetical protein
VFVPAGRDYLRRLVRDEKRAAKGIRTVSQILSRHRMTMAMHSIGTLRPGTFARDRMSVTTASSFSNATMPAVLHNRLMRRLVIPSAVAPAYARGC